MEIKFMNTVVELIESGQLPKTYAELVALHVPRPIGDKVMYENTVAIVDALAGHALNRDQDDYLEILSDLIESYEEENLPSFPRLSGTKMLQFLLDENEMSGEDLAKLLKIDRSAAYKILKGNRNLTAEHIRRLCERFSVRAELFL
jgi:antitoxin component HigA of HigAB toxin-antitoxin module